MTFHTLRPVRRVLVAGLVCAGVLLAVAPALASKKATTTDAHDYNERLVMEFTPLVGSREDTQTLVNRLRHGRPADEGEAASAVSATAPLSYGETRYALKLAQGRLAQDGITQPSRDQLQAALYGGTLETANGPKVLAGVLPQHARGVSWGNLAQDAGMSVEDLIPPASVRAKNKAHHTTAKGKKSGTKAVKKSMKPAAKKTTKSAGKTSAPQRKATPQKKVSKR